jgi:putative membrane protein
MIGAKNSPRMALAWIIGAAAVALASAATAQPPGSRSTRDFVQAAAQTDEFEILEAKTALAESQNAQVREFAQQMITAHMQTSRELRALAMKAGLEPPNPGVNGDQSMFLAALQSQRGTDFDKTYAHQQALVHRAALAVQQAYARSGDDGTIRQTAAATIPIISSHLRMAEEMEARLGN